MPVDDYLFNPFLKQYVLLEDGGVYFGDLEGNLIYKEPALRYCDKVHFVDEDLCLFHYTSSSKLVLYSMSKREIITRIYIRLPKKFGELNEIEQACYIKATNTVLFYAWYHDAKFSKHSIFAYNIKTKEYTHLLDGGLRINSVEYCDCIRSCMVYKNRFCFLLSILDVCLRFYVFNEDLTYKVIDFDEEFIKLYYVRRAIYDQKKGLLVFFEKGGFDGCYCKGPFPALDFDGNVHAWYPEHIYKDKSQNHNESNNDFEDYVLKHGIDKYVAENLSDEDLTNFAEDILRSGYNWALEQIEKKAKDAGLKTDDFLEKEQVPQDEKILYSVGWLQGEIENGGIEQYFCNNGKRDFELLINSLTTVGASETVSAIKKGVRMIENFNKKTSPSDYEYEKLSERFSNLECDLQEDYAALTIKYLMNSSM